MNWRSYEGVSGGLSTNIINKFKVEHPEFIWLKSSGKKSIWTSFDASKY